MPPGTRVRPPFLPPSCAWPVHKDREEAAGRAAIHRALILGPCEVSPRHGLPPAPLAALPRHNRDRPGRHFRERHAVDRPDVRPIRLAPAEPHHGNPLSPCLVGLTPPDAGGASPFPRA